MPSVKQLQLAGDAVMSNKRTGGTGRLVPAAMRAVDILEVLGSASAPMSGSEIAEVLGLPRTTTHELLNTMQHRRLILPVEGEVRRFTLGPLLLRLGSKYENQIDFASDAGVIARWLARESGETVHAAQLAGREVVYIAKVDTAHTVRMVSAVGRRLPAHTTSVGKALLATLREAELDELFPRGTRLERLTENSIVKLPELRTELQQIRKSGVAREWCESSEEVSCVAAAAYDHTGRASLALSIAVPISRHTEQKADEWSKLVAEGARELTLRLGGDVRDLTRTSITH